MRSASSETKDVSAEHEVWGVPRHLKLALISKEIQFKTSGHMIAAYTMWERNELYSWMKVGLETKTLAS